MGREDEIRLIAYSIWEEEGYPDNKDYEHWMRAEAIWEEDQKPNTSAKSSKQGAKPTAKVMAAKKKALKT